MCLCPPCCITIARINCCNAWVCDEWVLEWDCKDHVLGRSTKLALWMVQYWLSGESSEETLVSKFNLRHKYFSTIVVMSKIDCKMGLFSFIYIWVSIHSCFGLRMYILMNCIHVCMNVNDWPQRCLFNNSMQYHWASLLIQNPVFSTRVRLENHSMKLHLKAQFEHKLQKHLNSQHCMVKNPA